MIVVLVFSNLEEFTRYGESNGGLIRVLLQYCGPYSLSIFERLSGLLALMALLFSVAWLYRTNEFTALLAAGINKKRVVRPLLISSACVIIGACLSRELLIPRFQDQLDRQPQDLAGDLPRPVKPTFDQRAKVLFDGLHLLPVRYRIVGPTLRVHSAPGPLGKEMGRQISADFADYFRKPGRQGYMFGSVRLPANIDQIDSIYLPDGSPILLTSKDTEWVPPGSCFFSTQIEFEMMRGGSAWKQYAGTSEIIAHVRNPNLKTGDDMRVLVHQRFLRPAIDWTVLLLGLPVLLKRTEKHMFWIAGACLGIVTGFTAIVYGLAALGSAGYLVTPLLASWLPLLIFLPWGWAKTESAMQS